MHRSHAIPCLFLSLLAACGDDLPVEPDVVVLAESPGHASAVGLTDTEVIVVGEESLYAVPKAGGEAREIVDTGDRIWRLVAVDDDAVYWHAAGEADAIRAIDLTGEGLRELVSVPDLATAAIDDTHLYYGYGHGWDLPVRIERVAKSGGEAEVLGGLPERAALFGILVDETSVFLLGQDAEEHAAIWVLPKTGGTPTQIGGYGAHLATTTSDDTTAAFAADATYLYFWTRSHAHRVPKVGGATEDLYRVWCGEDGALDVTRLYWGCDSAARIFTGSKNGGAISTVDLGGYRAGPFAVDATRLYVASADGILAIETQVD